MVNPIFKITQRFVKNSLKEKAQNVQNCTERKKKFFFLSEVLKISLKLSDFF